MGGGLSVPRLADQHVTLNPGRRALSFLSKALGFLFQAIVQRGCLYDTATLHIAAPFQRENKRRDRNRAVLFRTDFSLLS
jgi:hypothetical protein